MACAGKRFLKSWKRGSKIKIIDDGWVEASDFTTKKYVAIIIHDVVRKDGCWTVSNTRSIFPQRRKCV